MRFDERLKTANDEEAAGGVESWNAQTSRAGESQVSNNLELSRNLTGFTKSSFLLFAISLGSQLCGWLHGRGFLTLYWCFFCFDSASPLAMVRPGCRPLIAPGERCDRVGLTRLLVGPTGHELPAA